MSLKELSEFDPHIKRIFGKVDFGGEQVKFYGEWKVTYYFALCFRILGNRTKMQMKHLFACLLAFASTGRFQLHTF